MQPSRHPLAEVAEAASETHVRTHLACEETPEHGGATQVVHIEPLKDKQITLRPDKTEHGGAREGKMCLHKAFDCAIKGAIWIGERVHSAANGILNPLFRSHQFFLYLTARKRAQVWVRPGMAAESDPRLAHLP